MTNDIGAARMSFLGNDAVNRINLHTGIFAFANGAGGIFFTAVLLKAGLSLPAALLAQAAIFAGRFVIRPAILPFAKRCGLKPLLIAGTIGLSLHYPLLPQITGAGAVLWLVLAIVAVAEVLYFPAYHTYFATLGDVEARGRQIAVREAATAIAGIVAPLIGTWLLVAGGPHLAFVLVGVIQVSAALPLLGLPNVPVLAEARGVLRAARLGAVLFALDGWYAAFLIAWQAALFLVLDRSYAAYGGAMALAGLVGAAYGFFVGHDIDAGRGRRAVAIAFTIAGAVIVFRAGSLSWAWLAVIANAAAAIVPPIYQPTLGTATYNLARAAPCPLRYNIALEATWDTGCALGCVAGAALIASGVPAALALLLALPALATAAWLLRRYYAAIAG
jgi:hypothetical protein